MYLLYTSVSLSVAYSIYKLVNYLFFPKLTSFDDDYLFVEDEYMFLSYTIKHIDNTNSVILEELSQEEVEKIDSENKIKYVIIDYLYNNKLMRYITYSLDIQFPIYEFDIDNSTGREIIGRVLLNEEDVTTYVKSFLGPKNNFYNDKNVKINLSDMFDDHPKLSEMNFNDGHLEIYAISGKHLDYPLPWTPIWKQFSGLLDETTEMNYKVESNINKSIYGFTILQ
jgi:hypothetical protein